MKNKKYYIALNDREYAEIISSLINKRNSLIRLGKYTDGVDEVIVLNIRNRYAILFRPDTVFIGRWGILLIRILLRWQYRH